MAAERRVVIGSGPGALRAAAAVAAAGYQVTLLQQDGDPAGLLHPRYPNGTGWMSLADDERGFIERVLGPTVEAPDPHRAVLRRRHRYSLPMQPWQVGRLLDRHARLPALQGWLKARSSSTAADLAGGGQEERSYRDWVVRRMGGPAYHHLYRDYALRRWGADGETLAAGLARQSHSRPSPGPFQVAGGGYDEVLRNAAAFLRGAGGEIVVRAGVQGLVLEQGRVKAVQTAQGDVSIAAGADVYVAASTATVCGWLGDAATSSMRVDAASLPVLPRVIVALRGEVDGLPDDLHVLDEGAPFWRVVVPYGIEKTALFHTTLPAPGATLPDLAGHAAQVARAARELGSGDFDPATAQVEVLAEWQPSWSVSCHARLRRTLRLWTQLGIVGVGRAGTFSELDPGTELGFVRRLLLDGGTE